MTSQDQHLKDIIEGRAPVPATQGNGIQDATSTSLGYGVQSSGPVDDTEAKNTKWVSREDAHSGPENPNVDAEQLATLAEGKVADAVDRKSGTQRAPGQTVVEDHYTGDLERKKQEQAEARQEIKQRRQAGVDVDGSLGGGRVGTEDNRDV
ncbi:hypothetical protein F5X68DRAFT_188170 [Plectosphaerella plurivora]|uniref:Uncharacterized protein n=1 Tax=Plectosphaerella plurivora TaxID=936078 RepID=A0A9P9AFY8_9PEZI|nr:hypothetical protein F5X68DRAFT_188170 [Plectosphaerella plurivora]